MTDSLSPHARHTARIVLWYTLSKGLTLAIFGLVFNLYLYAEGYDRQFIGLVNAMSAISSLFAAVPIGLLGDRIGQRPLLLITGFVNPLTMLGLAVTSAAPVLILFSLANGVVATMYWVSAIPLLAESTTPDRRVRLFALNSFLLWGAGSLGYLLGGQVVAAGARVLGESSRAVDPLRWGMLAVVAVGFLGAIPLPWLRHVPRPRKPKSARPPYDVRLYLRLLGPDMLLTCGGGSVAGFVGLYLTLRFGMRPANLGTFLTVSGLVGGVMVLLAPRVADRLGTTRAAILLQAGGVPAILLLTLAPVQAGAMVGELARNGFRSMGDPVYNAFAMASVPAEQRATISGLYAVTWSIGFSLGPAISGAIQQHAGFTPAFLAGACSMSAGVLLLWWFFPRRSSLAPPPPQALVSCTA
ncbi:MAG TPA: MFS transporter [Chloroflexota bacterium]|nr:MFS transporter [Chloroflexota bacterium]